MGRDRYGILYFRPQIPPLAAIIRTAFVLMKSPPRLGPESYDSPASFNCRPASLCLCLFPLPQLLLLRRQVPLPSPWLDPDHLLLLFDVFGVVILIGIWGFYVVLFGFGSEYAFLGIRNGVH